MSAIGLPPDPPTNPAAGGAAAATTTAATTGGATAAAPPVVDPVLRNVAKRVESGQCILFLGAGVHSPAPDASGFAYDAALAPPRGSELARRLATGSGYQAAFPTYEPTHLQRVAAHYESVLDRRQLVAAIRQEVGEGKQPSPALHALARLNFPLVITTNYDRLFETALTAAGKPFDRSTYQPSDSIATQDLESDPSAARPFVLKIHGDIETPESIVVTDEDYIQFILRMGDPESVNPIPLGLKFYLRRWPTLFIGYSLMDYNLRLLFKTLRWRMDRAKFPTSWAVDPQPDPLLVRVLGEGTGRQVSFIAQDVWAFVPTLYRLVTGQEMPR
ncbi:MAG TPA: SIR2 family protein [Gemmatimonadaceae bacterium]|nr:SIR2 family protein [Gemmatimonadaceae bacterium]